MECEKHCLASGSLDRYHGVELAGNVELSLDDDCRLRYA